MNLHIDNAEKVEKFQNTKKLLVINPWRCMSTYLTMLLNFHPNFIILNEPRLDRVYNGIEMSYDRLFKNFQISQKQQRKIVRKFKTLKNFENKTSFLKEILPYFYLKNPYINEKILNTSLIIGEKNPFSLIDLKGNTLPYIEGWLEIDKNVFLTLIIKENIIDQISSIYHLLDKDKVVKNEYNKYNEKIDCYIKSLEYYLEYIEKLILKYNLIENNRIKIFSYTNFCEYNFKYVDYIFKQLSPENNFEVSKLSESEFEKIKLKILNKKFLGFYDFVYKPKEKFKFVPHHEKIKLNKIVKEKNKYYDYAIKYVKNNNQIKNIEYKIYCFLKKYEIKKNENN